MTLPIIHRAAMHLDSIAFRTTHDTHTYGDLLAASESVAALLLGDESDLNGHRIALLLPPGFQYSAGQWSVWRTGGIVVPLSLTATESEWEYALDDSGSTFLLTDHDLATKVASLCQRRGVTLVDFDQAFHQNVSKPLPVVSPAGNAMILYTSGTTSQPKGVVTTHSQIQAQIECLVESWEWSSADRVPLFLPLHHIHGIINITSCGLWTGALIEPFSRFDISAILQRVCENAYTLFMAVPTIYVKLIQALESIADDKRQSILDGFGGMRLMVSGSAALPSSVHEKWSDLTGQKLLERYGMTEIGMALSNPYHGQRRPGTVGVPMPGVEVRLKSDRNQIIDSENEPGEIQVRGPSVFSEYWNRLEATRQSFDEGWFRTGDVGIVEDGYYRIMGRLSVDIIKSGGYKLSALEIESKLLEHPDIRECAVIGLPDETWGECVSVALVLQDQKELEFNSLRDWCKSRMSVYKIPQRILIVDELPRNAMGKVTKPAIRDLFATMTSSQLD